MDPAAANESARPGRASRIRAVAKIWSSSEIDHSGGSVTVAVSKPQGEDSRRVTISFGDQPLGYELDFCYEQQQGNSIVFEREVQPLIHRVFGGNNVTTIVTGTNDGEKSRLIQGLSEDRGLITLTAAAMIEMAKKNEKIISVSMFEATSDRVFDILDSTNRYVLPMGDSAKNFQLKGLSRVTVVSTQAFQNLFDSGFCKSKLSSEPFRKSHIGLTFYVSTPEGQLVGKINFVDLAGYQNIRKRNYQASSLPMIMKINKSIHAVHNVLYALSANEIHVPYRETKLTHMLQDSFGGASTILLITCLNQLVCQDSICMVSLASRSCQHPIKGTSSTIKKPKSSVKTTIIPFKSPIICGSSAKSRNQSASNILSVKKEKYASSALKARKLFVEKKINQLEQCQISSQLSSLDITSAPENSCNQEEKPLSNIVNYVTESNVDIIPLTIVKQEEIATFDKEIHISEEYSINNTLLLKERTEDYSTNMTPLRKEGEDTEKENSAKFIDGGSPSISSRLQALSSSLKLLYNSTPSCANAAGPLCPLGTPNSCIRTDGNIMNYCSPWQAFSESGARAKDSLVKDYLSFLNTASKDDLKKLKGIGDKRATYIIDLRTRSTQPFKQLDDLKDIGLSDKQIHQMVRNQIGGLFN